MRVGMELEPLLLGPSIELAGSESHNIRKRILGGAFAQRDKLRRPVELVRMVTPHVWADEHIGS